MVWSPCLSVETYPCWGHSYKAVGLLPLVAALLGLGYSTITLWAGHWQGLFQCCRRERGKICFYQCPMATKNLNFKLVLIAEIK